MKLFLTRRRRILIGVVLGLVLLLGGAVLAQMLLDPLDCRIAKDVAVGGVELGGMTWGEAQTALKAAEKETIHKKSLILQLPGKTLEIVPKESNFRLCVFRAVRDAYRVGRKKDAVEPILKLSDYLTFEEEYLQKVLKEYASHYDTKLTAPEWKLRGQAPALGTDVYDPEAQGQSVELTMGLPERHLNVEDAMGQILRGLDRGLLAVEPITLEVPCKTEPEKPDLEAIYATCAIAAKDDALDMETYQVIHGSYGYHFDVEKAQTLVDAAGYGETVSIPMEAYPPEICGEGVYYRDVLGTCDTKHTDDENRNTNLRLVCEFLDGMVIQPGEGFSYNAAVGERTPERGFMPANVFSGNRMTKDYGGGVCQGSTTLYNCLLLADMEVTERHGHGAVVTYVPLGLDAAVNWATNTDLQFINNSHFPVMIRAEVSDGYMKMQLLGTDEKDYYIKLEARQYEEGGYIYAGSYKQKYDKATDEQISRDRIAFSSYDLSITG